MMNKNERMEKLNQAGINTGKYFNIDLPQGLKPGATISVVINEDGQPVVVTEHKHDPIAKQIITDGYVRNTKLFRRWVMAHMFANLNYKSYDVLDEGYSACLRRNYSYQYTFDMMLEEVRVLSKLEERDRESFEERKHFFTHKVVLDVALDYMDKLEKYVESLPEKKCKGVPYKRIKGNDIFVEDLNKKLYRPLMSKIMYLRYATSYTSLYRYLNDFMKDMIKLPSDTPKSKAWIDAFKGEGAYYTLKNLVMFHNCKIFEDGMASVFKESSMRILSDKLYEYQGEGWRMFALMKKVISDNNINTKTYIADICEK